MAAFLSFVFTLAFGYGAWWCFDMYRTMALLTDPHAFVWVGVIGWLVGVFGKSTFIILGITSAFISLRMLIEFIKRLAPRDVPASDPVDHHISREFFNGQAQTRYDLNVGGVLGDNEIGFSIQDILRSLTEKQPVLSLRTVGGVIRIYADGTHIGNVQQAYTSRVMQDFSRISEVGGLSVSESGGLYSASFYIIVK